MRLLRSLVLCALLSPAPILASMESSVAASAIASQVEAELANYFRAGDSLSSDRGVLLATHYRRIIESRRLDDQQRLGYLTRLLAACKEPFNPVHRPPLIKVPASEVPALLDGGDREGLARALAWARKAAAKSKDGWLPFGGQRVRRADLVATLDLFEQLLARCPDAPSLAAAVTRSFDVYRSPGLNPQGEVLFTSYCDPVFEGSLTPGGAYRYPLYKEPKTKGLDNDKYPRSEIAKGALKGHQLEIAWMTNALDAYLLEVEGSGLVHLTDGRYLKVQFSGKNGRAYKSLGKAVVRAGLVKPWEMDMLRIRRLFDRNPDKLQAYLDLNPSFVYFKGELLDSMPERLEYTAERSLACDQKYFPRAGLGFIALARPVFDGDSNITSWKRFNRFAVNQDTGGAIKGPGHIDIYWGHDPDANRVSSVLREPGTLYYLLKKGTALKTAGNS